MKTTGCPQPKVALLMSNLLPGGIQQVIFKLARNFVKNGNKVHLLVLSSQGTLPADFPKDIQIFDLRLRNKTLLFFRLALYLLRERPDSFLSTHPHLNVIAIFAALATRSKTRVAVSEHNNPRQAYKDRKSQNHKVSTPFLERILYPYADAIVAVSNGVALDMAPMTKIPFERIQVIYNPIVDDELSQKANEVVNWPFEEDTIQRKKIIAVGRLSPQKNFSVLLHAFAILHQRKLDARLLILGEGRERGKLENLARELGLENKVSLYGVTSNPYAFMSMADVCVATSLWEGFPLVIAEALACGTQVVSTDCRSGPAEILDDGKYGWLTPINDPMATANAILQALARPLPTEMLKQRAQSFSTKQAAEEYRKLLGLL
ncbi:MAG: glycosyltransferase [Anaerolineales bacterium]|nr:glycosyltransferase [Anaerolineales bacterium]